MSSFILIVSLLHIFLLYGGGGGGGGGGVSLNKNIIVP